MKNLAKTLLLLALTPAFSDVYHVYQQPQQPEVVYVQSPQISYQPEYRTIASFGNGYGSVELDDTSNWTVLPESQRFLSAWAIGDVITFFPNTTWNRGKFCLLNNRLNSTVFVDADKGPFDHLPTTNILIALDPTNTYATLRSNTGQHFQFLLGRKNHDWRVGDVISIGTNNPQKNCCGGGYGYYLYSWNAEEGSSADMR